MAARNKNVYLAALALFALGLGWLIFSGLSENQVYFLNVGEALAMKPGQLNQARLFGTVSGQDLRLAEGGLGARFLLQDKDDPRKVMVVDYSGAVPDTFKPGVEVIVEGGLDHSKGLFTASTLMTKCPSKYQKQNRG
jgi:cytochrome c-type biogenesis protein CcmE